SNKLGYNFFCILSKAFMKKLPFFGLNTSQAELLCPTYTKKIHKEFLCLIVLYHSDKVIQEICSSKFEGSGASQKFFPHLQPGWKTERFISVLTTVDLHCRRTLSIPITGVALRLDERSNHIYYYWMNWNSKAIHRE